MGPIIILDKSVLQTLSFIELDFLYRYFLINVSPVLIAEIQGDLSKSDKDGKPMTDLVTRLASKIPQITSAVNFHYRDLILNSLMGSDVPMDGRVPVFGGSLMRDGSDQLGAVIPETPEERAIQRWRDGNFSASERDDAAYWRETTRSFDYEPILESFAAMASDLPTSASVHDVQAYIDAVFAHPENQGEMLEMVLAEFPVGPSMDEKVRQRWAKAEFTYLKDFAPYAYYCLALTWKFYLGVAKKVIGARPTNFVDLEYIYYLPFSQVFTSSDKFHKAFVPLFLRPDQSFVWGDDLRGSLKAIASVWEGLSEQDRPAWLRENGRYPPDDPNSVVTRLWREHCRYRPRSEREPSAEEKARTLEMLRNRSASLRPAGIPVPGPGDPLAEVEFIDRVRTVHADDPCPCRSGLKFSACHLPQILASQ